MNQCDMCCFGYNCTKDQDHKGVHAFVSRKYLTKFGRKGVKDIRRIEWAD